VAVALPGGGRIVVSGPSDRAREYPGRFRRHPHRRRRLRGADPHLSAPLKDGSEEQKKNYLLGSVCLQSFSIIGRPNGDE
jgi:hypothetical protein